MSKTKLEEIMEEVIPVLNGITDELESYELTKEQYEWFLVEAAKKEELEERVKELEESLEHSTKMEVEMSEELLEDQYEIQRYKQALEEIKYKYVSLAPYGSEAQRDAMLEEVNKVLNEIK